MKSAGQYFAERVKANGDKPAQEMTKREMIAAMLLQGMLVDPGFSDVSAIDLADDLLANLERTK